MNKIHELTGFVCFNRFGQPDHRTIAASKKASVQAFCRCRWWIYSLAGERRTWHFFKGLGCYCTKIQIAFAVLDQEPVTP